MNIPEAIGKLGDLRGVPLLLKVISKTRDVLNRGQGDDDSDDDIMASISTDRLFTESCLALGQFKGSHQIILDINRDDIDTIGPNVNTMQTTKTRSMD